MPLPFLGKELIMNLNLLEKLEQVEVQVTDRFPADDMEYCRKYERYFTKAYGIYDEVVQICNEAIIQINNLPSQKYVRDIENNIEVIHSCNQSFINKICSYFRNKYNVSIEDPEWAETKENRYGRKEKKKKYEMVPLQYILDSIYEQMGGMSFGEKAFSELKEKIKRNVVSYNKSKYCIKGNKLIINDFYYSYKCSIYKKYKARVESHHRSFLVALAHFEYGCYDLLQKYSFLSVYELDEDKGVYDKHDISSSVIDSIKVFKNGKLEVEFKDYSMAERFMETYFPGIPQQKAA